MLATDVCLMILDKNTGGTLGSLVGGSTQIDDNEVTSVMMNRHDDHMKHAQKQHDVIEHVTYLRATVWLTIDNLG